MVNELVWTLTPAHGDEGGLETNASTPPAPSETVTRATIAISTVLIRNTLSWAEVQNRILRRLGNRAIDNTLTSNILRNEVGLTAMISSEIQDLAGLSVRYDDVVLHARLTRRRRA